MESLLDTIKAVSLGLEHKYNNSKSVYYTQEYMRYNVKNSFSGVSLHLHSQLPN